MYNIVLYVEHRTVTNKVPLIYLDDPIGLAVVIMGSKLKQTTGPHRGLIDFVQNKGQIWTQHAWNHYNNILFDHIEESEASCYMLIYLKRFSEKCTINKKQASKHYR